MWKFLVSIGAANLSSLKSYKEKLEIHCLLMGNVIKTMNTATIDKERWEKNWCSVWFTFLPGSVHCRKSSKNWWQSSKIQVNTQSRDGSLTLKY